MKVMTRMQAAELGLLRYYTGKPCKHGHKVERYTRTNTCVECARLAGSRFNAKVNEALARAAEGSA